jgi:multidrug efflux pump subunit AcrA (membrane-fusion protein)
MATRSRLWMVGLLLAVLVSAGGCADGPSASSQEPTPTPIPPPPVPDQPTYVVKRGDVQDSLTFSGRVSPAVEEELFFETSGRVKAVFVERGDPVEEGQLLAELDNDDLLRQLDQALIELDTATLNYDSAIASKEYQIERAQLNLELNKLQLEKLREAGQDRTSVQLARVNLEKAQIAVELAQAAFDRRKSQPGWEASPEALNLQQRTLDLEAVRATYNQAVQNASLSEYDLAVREVQIELAELDLAYMEREVDPQLAKAVDRAQLTVDRLESFIEDTRIYSPIDGEVTTESLREGEVSEGFRTVIVVADDSELIVAAEPLSTQMQKLSEGMECSIALSAYPGKELSGIVEQLPYPYGGGGGSAEIEDQDKRTLIDFDPEDLDLRSGDLVRVTVILEKKTDVLWLPPAAIRTFSGRKFVVIEEEGRQRRVDVTVGIESDERVEIEEGLEEGQVVVGA